MTLRHPTRSLIVKFRVTPAELDVLRRAADDPATAAAGSLTLSDYIRSRLFDYAAVPVAKQGGTR